MDDTGYHYIIDFKVRANAVLKDPLALKAIFGETLRNFTVIGYDHHKFDEGGGGVTGFFLLSESHCSYHTYPENNYIAVDVFTCGSDPGDVAAGLARRLDAVSYSMHFLKRGSHALGAHASSADPLPLAA